jgi:hypothetical protein
MSESQWFSCAPTAGDQSISRRHSALPFWVSAQKLEVGIQILRFRQWKLLCVASAMLPIASHHGRLQHPRDYSMGQFHLDVRPLWCYDWLQRQGPHACKLPLKCQPNESRKVAQHTTSITIQGRAGYVQRKTGGFRLLARLWLLERLFLIAS